MGQDDLKLDCSGRCVSRRRSDDLFDLDGHASDPNLDQETEGSTFRSAGVRSSRASALVFVPSHSAAPYHVAVETEQARDRRPSAQLLADVLRVELARPADRLLVLLLLADVAIVVVHLMHAYTPAFRDDFYAITRDRGLAEIIRYYKLGLVILALLAVATSRRSISYAAWAVVIGLVLWDDVIGTRERLAERVAAWLDLPAVLGLRPQDLGELVVVGFYLLAIAGPVFVAYRVSRPDRRFWWSMVTLLAAVFFFNVGVDIVHVVVRDTGWAGVLGAIEEGSATIVITFILRLAIEAWFEQAARHRQSG